MIGVSTRRRIAVWVASIAVCCVVVPAFATDVWFSDSRSKSSNGRFLASAESPDNRRRSPPPFQDQFVYQLRDAASGRVLWRIKEDDALGAGGTLYVSNSGRVMIVDGMDRFTVIQPDAKRTSLPGALQIIPKREIERYGDHTTAGIFWSQYAWDGLWEVDGREYFHLRTYWGREILIDLEHAKVLNDKKTLRAINAELLARSLRVAAFRDQELSQACKSCKGRHIREEVSQSLFFLAQRRPQTAARLEARIRKAEPKFSGSDELQRLRGGPPPH
jgi:hypothetical protein